MCSEPRLREEVYPVRSEPLIPPERGGLPSVQWALQPSWERRFTLCAVGPSSLLREEVYPVCSEPLIPPVKESSPSVQWALHPSWERRLTQCAVSPSSLLREDVRPVCSGPLIPPERGDLPSVQLALHPSWERRLIPTVQWALHPSWERRSTQCAMGPSSLLREEVYPVCSGPLLPHERGGLYLLCSGPLIPLARGGLPSVQWALRPSWERRFTQCAAGPSSLLIECAVGSLFLLRGEVYLVCSGPLIPSKRWGSPSVQWTPHPSWKMKFIDFAVCLSSLTLPDTKMRFTKCVVGPSFLLINEVYQVHSGPLIPSERWCLSIVQWTPHPWLCLIDEIYQMCSGSLIPVSASNIRFTQ